MVKQEQSVKYRL